MGRASFIGGAVILLAWLAWDQWIYLQSSYSIQIDWPGHVSSATHVEFPSWRIVVHAVLSGAALVAILECVVQAAWPPALAWATFFGTVAVNSYDRWQYGFLASPTSIWLVLLLLFIALVASFERRRTLPRG